MFDIYDEILDKLSFYIFFLRDIGITVSFSDMSSEIESLYPVLVAHRERPENSKAFSIPSDGDKLLTIHLAITGDAKKLENPLNPKVYNLVCGDASDEEKLQLAADGFAEVIDDIHQTYTTYSNTRDKRYDVFVKAIKFMFTHYADPELSATKISHALGYSLSHIEHIFKKFSRSTPSRYLLDVRLLEAEKLLRNTQLSISEITTLVGFKSTNYFSIAYKARYKMTPSMWRVKNKKGVG